MKQTDDFLHAECRIALFEFVDDLELQLRPTEALIAVRSASRLGYWDLGVNRRRVEALRASLRARGILRESDAHSVLVRREEPGDIASVRQVNIQAFGQAEEADIVDRIRRGCDEALSLVAVSNDLVVGHVLFSPVTIEHETGVAAGMALGPMAVLPRHQRQGIGSNLVLTGLEEMRRRQCPFVLLVGHPEYYPRFGFEPAGRRGVRCEWDVPAEAFLILVLREPEMRGVTGLARYRPEFTGSSEPQP